ncbi:MAG: hypothetical protein LBQ63_00105 [Deltaproteobacteria bacterium]|jgi:predicted glutamine amidotransferase|nr:hypothetical protein [Deltaproteobacteria bacterium]
MCIIVVKPRGVQAPSHDILDNCFNNNQDGAGFAVYYPLMQKARIQKGFMKKEAFSSAIDSAGITKEDIVIYHFRITTAGGTAQKNCHPFPISDNVSMLEALDVYTDNVIAHNGILGKGKETLSDTMLYIKDTLSQYNDIIKHFDEIKEETEGSRLAFILAGEIYLTGRWIYEDGIFYSNDTYSYSHQSWPYYSKNKNWEYYLNDETYYGYDTDKKDKIICACCEAELDFKDVYTYFSKDEEYMVCKTCFNALLP